VLPQVRIRVRFVPFKNVLVNFTGREQEVPVRVHRNVERFAIKIIKQRDGLKAFVHHVDLRRIIGQDRANGIRIPNTIGGKEVVEGCARLG